MLYPLLLVLACAPEEDTSAAGTSPAPTEEPPGHADTESVPGVEDPDDDEDYDWVFDDTLVHQVHLELSETAQDALRVDPYTWVEGTFSMDGSEPLTVGVRLRGKIGSFQELDEKPKWKVDFNRYVDGQTFHGLETLAFNNSVVDCSFLRELLAYQTFNVLGVPASRMAFSWITVNDEVYGLYQMLEFNDDEFLEEHYGKPIGNLYDGKYIYGGGWDYTFIDFTPSQQDNFTLEEGEDVGLADIYLVTSTMGQHRGKKTFYEATGEVIDWPSVHPFLAAEHWTGQWDGYTLDTNNYRVYFDPALDGRMRFLTTDLDYAFSNLYSQWFDWSEPQGELVNNCYLDPLCTEAQRQAVAVALDTLDVDTILAQLDAWYEVASEEMRNDPRGGCTPLEVVEERDGLYAWVEGREAELREHWGL